MEIIKVENLHKSFGDNNVLRGIDLNIEQGDVVVIIGPSGSGKSTFLRTLNLLEQPTSGKIYFEGTDITDPKTDINLHRQKMGMVFQHFNLFPHLTILTERYQINSGRKPQDKGYDFCFGFSLRNRSVTGVQLFA